MNKLKSIGRRLLRLITVLTLLYVFLVSIKLMGHAFKGFGEGFAESLIQTTSNPFVALFIGILATSIIQSSSTTTSIVVGMVSAGTLTVSGAIPLVMGANIGTSVTNTLVSFAHVTRKEEFKRAFSSSLIHDIFNVSCVIILFPIEMTTHILEKTASVLSMQFAHSAAFKFTSPLKVAIKPVIHMFDILFQDLIHLPGKLNYVAMLFCALALLFIALFFIVRVMKSLVIKRTEVIFDKVLGRSGVIGILMGALFTAIIQSSSVTTSLMVPLAASGIVTLEQILPIVLGANLGTTVTAILASLAGTQVGVTIAFVHLLFNTVGILIFYPSRFMRGMLLKEARSLGEMSLRSRKYAFMYVAGVFFIIPLILIFLSKLF
ncbi:MAG: Na/Pi symporter [Candidatus Omnitrophica bacterium]|nr:Na/Pi symporter [Candidatus Omnitrophota bacterium]